MNYSTFVKQVAEKLNLSQAEADRYVKSFTQVVLDSLKDNESVDISGFGKFKNVTRKARMGVNPKNPTIKISIPESKALGFKQSLAIKRLLNS